MSIEEWLDQFKKAWTDKNIDSVMKLFSKDVIYYETPFVKLNSYSELEREWQSIEKQSDISLNLELFSSHKNKHTVIWHLNYTVSKSKNRELRGTYLIGLNDDGLCTYFYHTGESKSDY